MEYELPVKVKKVREGGYFASCPVWQDCYAQAETLEEVLFEIQSVAATLIDIYKEEGKRIPLKKTRKGASRSGVFNVPVLVSA